MLPFSLCTPCRQVAAATRKIGCSRQRIAPPCHAQLPLQHSPASALEPHAALRTRHLASSPPEATSNPTAASSGSSDGFDTPFPSSVTTAAPKPLRSYGAQHIYNRGSVSSVSTSGTLDEVSLDCLCDEPDSHGACFYANFSAFGCAAEVQRTLMDMDSIDPFVPSMLSMAVSSPSHSILDETLSGDEEEPGTRLPQGWSWAPGSMGTPSDEWVQHTPHMLLSMDEPTMPTMPTVEDADAAADSGKSSK